MEKELYKVVIHNSINYEGLLNNHEDYLKMLNILEKKTSYIGITSDHEIIDEFKDDIFQIEESNTWWGIETSYKEELYYIKASKRLFTYLTKYETFCKTLVNKWGGLYADETDFGTSDIAFFKNDDTLLLRTNTHEGFIFVTEEVDKEFNKD